MSNEIKYYGLASETGLTLTASVYNYDGTLNTGSIALTEIGTTGRYTGTFPAIAAGDYVFEIFNGSTSLGSAEISWDGAAEVSRKTLDDAVIDVPNTVWDEALSGHQTAGSAGRNLTFAGTILAETTLTGTPTTTTFQLTAGSATDDFYNDMEVVFITGPSAGLSRIVSDYVGATKTITVDEALPAAPVAANAVVIRTLHKHTKTQIAAAVWDTLQANHTTADTFGEIATEIASILADTNELQTDWADGGRLDLLVDAILADTNELQTDWADGGRLDLLVDAILADTGTDGVVISATTANQIADALLNRDMSLVSDTTARSPLNALRLLRNKYIVAGNILTVTKEDDLTTAWTSALTTDTNALPVVGSDPA